MTIYPDEQKARLIERMLPPQNADVVQLSKETGIPKDTLYGWRRQARRARRCVGSPKRMPSKIRRFARRWPLRG